MNTEQILTRLHITPTSRLIAVQEVRQLIEGSDNPINAAKTIISNLSTGDFNTDDAIVARMTAQRLVEDAIILGERFDSTDSLRRAAEKIAGYRVTDPWFFFKPESSTVSSTTQTREGVQVEIKDNGKIKKGGKQILAKALYEKNSTLDNASLIKLFMKELDMSKPGATTYVYNCKKAAK